MSATQTLGRTVTAAARKSTNTIRSLPDRKVTSDDSVALAQRCARLCAVPLVVDGRMGWKTRRWVRMFQASFQLGEFADTPLTVDGKVGPNTARALKLCIANNGRVSKHFYYREFRTRLGQGDEYKPTDVSTTNEVVKVDRKLVSILEYIRKALGGRAIHVRSGYRDDWWNIAVGGANLSQHRKGKAADLDYALGIPMQMAANAGATGVGVDIAHVTHLDSRTRPASWWYRRPANAARTPAQHYRVTLAA